MAIDALLGAAQNQVTVTELDIQNEVDLFNFTVMARLIYDNVPADASTGSVDVLNQLRSLMSNHGFDPGRVFPSTTDFRSTVAGTSCTSVYGDSARVIRLDENIGAISGGLFGFPASLVVTNGLPCGGTIGTTDPMIPLPVSYSPPNIVDLHAYPCVVSGSGGCDLSQSSSLLASEASQTFSDIQALLNTWSPTGWRGYNPTLYTALVTIGETHSTTDDGSGKTCEGSPLFSPQATYSGYIASSLNGHYTATGTPGTVLRMWNVVDAAPGVCYGDPNAINVAPPYYPAP